MFKELKPIVEKLGNPAVRESAKKLSAEYTEGYITILEILFGLKEPGGETAKVVSMITMVTKILKEISKSEIAFDKVLKEIFPNLESIVEEIKTALNEIDDEDDDEEYLDLDSPC